MGYDTEFSGEIKVTPPLNQAEINYLEKFARTRHCIRAEGEFYVDGRFGWDDTKTINANAPYPNQPALWCHFEASEDGTELIWNGSEKTYGGPDWIRYIIDNFLSESSPHKDAQIPWFKEFTFDHVCNGVMLAQGQDIHDRFKIIVENNQVTVIDLE